MKRVWKQRTGLYWFARREEQRRGFAVRFAKDPVSGELCCSLVWPGGRLWACLMRRLPELAEK